MMKTDERGFSLLEIMVAFTLLALSVGVLMQAFGGGVDLLGNAVDQGRVVSLARTQMAKVGTEWPIEEGDYSGEWQNYHWQVHLEPFETFNETTGNLQIPISDEEDIENPSVRLIKVVVIVTWLDRTNERRYELSSLRLALPS